MMKIFRWLVISIFAFPSLLISYERTFDVCAIFKNEARFLSEWIDYHRLVGVECFWLYNNNSEDNYLEVLDPYIKDGIVHLKEWPSEMQENDWSQHSFVMQTGAYIDCIQAVRGKTKWVALIDIDEFIVPVSSDSVVEILESDFDGVSGLCINWILFGTSHVPEIKSDELMIETLILRAPFNHPKNLLYKSIVFPEHVKDCVNPHYCLYQDDYWHVDTNKNKVDHFMFPELRVEKIKLHHYWSKDIKFFLEEKIPRYIRWGTPRDNIDIMIQENNRLNSEEDFEMQRFIPRLKKERINNFVVG